MKRLWLWTPASRFYLGIGVKVVRIGFGTVLANKKAPRQFAWSFAVFWDFVLGSDWVVVTEPGFDIIEVIVKREVVDD